MGRRKPLQQLVLAVRGVLAAPRIRVQLDHDIVRVKKLRQQWRHLEDRRRLVGRRVEHDLLFRIEGRALPTMSSRSGTRRRRTDRAWGAHVKMISFLSVQLAKLCNAYVGPSANTT